jgi:hypothetical protein
MDFFWEILQSSRVYQATAAAQEAKTETRSTRSDVHQLQQEVQHLRRETERLVLALTALAEIVCSRLDITTVELNEKIREIDLRDGKLDGKLSLHAKRCPQCQRDNSPKRAVCLYCGCALPAEPFV